MCYSAVWEYPTQLICVIGDKVMSLGISHDTIDDIPCCHYAIWGYSSLIVELHRNLSFEYTSQFT
jgi:hypothetical protein